MKSISSQKWTRSQQGQECRLRLDYHPFQLFCLSPSSSPSLMERPRTPDQLKEGIMACACPTLVLRLAPAHKTPSKTYRVGGTGLVACLTRRPHQNNNNSVATTILRFNVSVVNIRVSVSSACPPARLPSTRCGQSAICVLIVPIKASRPGRVFRRSEWPDCCSSSHVGRPGSLGHHSDSSEQRAALQKSCISSMVSSCVRVASAL